MAEYKITIKKTDGKPDKEDKPNLAPKEEEAGALKAATYAVALYTAKKAVSFVSSHIETYTGDSQAQQAVNMAMKIIGYGAAIVANPALGIAAVALDLTTSMIDRAYTNKWERIEQSNTHNVLGGYSYGRSR